MADATLYIVATPIGNLADMVPRAVEILQTVDVIAAEDTRHSRRLLSHFNIGTSMMSYHEYSDEKRLETLIGRLAQGQSVALISDAGTPLISDPGYRLVRSVREQGFRVVPIPGPCALVTALSVAGLPTDRFVFEGFLPAKSNARRLRLESVQHEERTLVFYESPHRIQATLQAMREAFGDQREVVIARELTKMFETVLSKTLAELCELLDADGDQRKGEFVVMVAGFVETATKDLSEDALRTVKILAEELPPKKAAALAEKITGVKKKVLYEALLS